MGKLNELNIGHNLDISISRQVTRNSYWGHIKNDLSSVFNCLQNIFIRNKKFQKLSVFPKDNWLQSSHTYLEITIKNQLLDLILKFNINTTLLVMLQNESSSIGEHRKVGFVYTEKCK